MEIINILKIRELQQQQNNEKVAKYLSLKNITLKELSEVINKNELERVLIELNSSFKEFHKKCLESFEFRIVVSGRISKRASRQGVSHELFILNKINNFIKQFGVFISKPKRTLVIHENKIRLREKVKTSSFRSIDAIVSGKLTAFVICKFILGRGSSQENSWAEVKSIIEWAIKYKFKNDNLIFLIDTDDLITFEKIKLLVLDFDNMHVFSHVCLQTWVKNTVK